MWLCNGPGPFMIAVALMRQKAIVIVMAISLIYWGLWGDHL